MKILITFLIIVFSFTNFFASHVPGGNITYECVGPNQFVVTLTFFEDCGTAFEGPNAANITLTDDCGYNVGAIQLPNVVYQEEVSQLCSSQLPFSECNGGTLPGIYMHVWQDTITLPGTCDSWTFSYSNCCRNESTNLVGVSSNYYYETILNSSTAPCNTSPSVTTQMIPYVCVNQPLVYNLGVYEPDGNTMVYTLVNAVTASGVSVPYQPGYSGAVPMNGMTINSVTGDLNFTPNIVGNFVVAVLVEEFDSNGDLVGSLVQDFQFEVINCPANTNPVEPAGITNYTGDGSLIAPNEISMCGGDSFCFDITFTDLNSTDSIFIDSNIDLALPGATVTQTSWQSPATAEVCWVASNNVASPTSVVFSARDNACPIFGMSFYPIIVRVIESTTIGPDQTLCAGDSASILAEGGTEFQWEALPGGDTIIVGNTFSCDTCTSVFATPSITTTYAVVSDLGGGCVNTDTMTVNVVPDFAYTLTQSAATSCIGHEIQLEATPNIPGTYVYTWSPSDDLDNPTISNPIFTPSTSGTFEYYVEILGPTGCVKYDTILINVTPSFAPDFTLTASPMNINCGDTVLLNSVLNYTPPAFCGPSVNTVCSSVPIVSTIGVASGANDGFTYPAPFGNWYRNAKHQFLYTAAELNAMGVIAGKITQLSWGVTAITGDSIFNDFSIKMGCTSNDLLVNWEAGLTDVYAPQNYQIALGSNDFVFTTGYNWDGLSNIVIELCYNNLATPYTTNAETPWEDLGVNRTLYYRNDGSLACSYTGLPTTSTFRPITSFVSCDLEPDPVNYTFEWSPAASINNPNIDSTYALPQIDTEYQLVVTDLNGGCTDSSTIEIAVQCCETPDVIVTDVTCFQGGDGVINVTPVTTVIGPYTVELIDPSSSTVLQSDNMVMTDVDFVNLGTGTYLITFLDATGCTSDTTVTINEPFQIVVDAGNDTIVCLNDSIQLDASGGVDYNWMNPVNISDPNIANPYFYGITSQLHFVNITDVDGCSGVDSVFVTVHTLPTAEAGEDVWLCEGFGTQLLGSGGVTYSWSPITTLDDPSLPNPTATPIDTTLYFLEVTDANGCVNIDSVTVFTDGVVPTDAGNDTTICEGDTLQLGGNPSSVAGSTFSWTPANLVDDATVSNPMAFPTVDTWFYLTTTNDTCSGLDSVFVTVNPYPLADAGSNIQICIGDTAQLNASGGIYFTWNTNVDLSNETISNPLAWPTDTTEFVVNVTDALGCSQTDTLNVIVNPLPIVDAGINDTICFGDTTQLLASGGDFYLWSPLDSISNENIDNPIVWPSAATSYIVAVTDSNGCVNSDSVEVFVNELPIVDLGPDVSMCIFDSIQLQATGAVNYNWTDGTFLSDDAIANPYALSTVDGTYIVIGEDANGCLNSDTISVMINALPVITAGSDVQICIGDSTQLSAGGGVNYIWNNATTLTDANVVNPIAFPTDTISYVVVGEDVNSCFNSDTVIVVVNPLPIVMAGNDVAICFGDTVQLSGNGLGTISWLPADSISNAVILDPLVWPSQSTDYIMQVVDSNLCVNSDTVLVTVNALPLVDLGPDVSMCIFDSIQLQATGSIDYNWTDGTYLSDTTIANPYATNTVDNTFVVIGEDVNGCINSDTINVTINALPIVSAGSDVQICIGDSTQLNAGGAVNYVWDNALFLTDGNIGNPIAFPVDTTSFIVMGEDVNSCFNSDTVVVIVNPLPIVSAGNDVDICLGDSAQLVATGGDVYAWEPIAFVTDANIFNPIAFPDTTVQFIVTVTDSNLCVNQDSVIVNVFRISTIPDTTICDLESVQLDVLGSPGDFFSWTPVDYLTDPSIANPIATPPVTTTYSVDVTNTVGCEDQASVTITVNDIPQPNFSYTVEPGCDGVVVEITDSSALTDFYSWTFSNGEISTEASPTVIFEYGGDFTMQLTASNQFGCSSIVDTAAIAGSFVDYYDIHIPNVFTPNGDNENDAFWIETPGHLSQCLELNVFNRWGQLIFKSAGNVISWDGKTSTGQDVPEGTYMFTIVLKEYVYEGTVSLFR
jgi:gliding motility-associated-like protein